ncbi:hypothetical protein PP459_gp038 [Streptomyces phage Wakanda]|uniref:Uncharacterized protein n=1 Tax=Streptomyces phage Wakanda TaxID=2713267 RepID=A0A6G8R1V7_9CAUD|nr:hypothetical protein PP459_gp038 [Streptomyces phage Wakanda]QIN94195.1 hypothetical protein SEA_WAKANDA_235 [Streptomyces phage Wakanda]
MNGFLGNTPFTTTGSNGIPPANPGRGPGQLDASGKAGKAFMKAMDSLSFDANIFAYYVVAQCRGILRKRLLQVVFAIIRSLADHYDSGDMDEETTNAKRLMDTMAVYGMDGENP